MEESTELEAPQNLKPVEPIDKELLAEERPAAITLVIQ